MRKGYYSSRKMWWVIPNCRSKRISRSDQSRMDIEEIVKMKLETIKEEPAEMMIDELTSNKQRGISKRVVKKIHLKAKMGKIFMSQLSLKESYVIFMTGFASKGGLSGLPRY